jgi:hypothetical protein
MESTAGRLRFLSRTLFFQWEKEEEEEEKVPFFSLY